MASSQLANDTIIGCQLLKEYGVTINFGRGNVSYVREGIYKQLDFEQRIRRFEIHPSGKRN
jgi:hypothetical protein